eukprot:Plantae.Rhodophyta-Purpureofilum_apyrenoidigerum.ctg17412.p1 GENE.Plantae.Rhodophyta-Purpureofilum_apyrenoidigerum.ctg17412~~Plantae.Rhodophyta-Purpureofilum_apyrenoidigerum.ctg17412.p1  ORF type:complete len:484 (+),score=44.17 Plantae.Rhodophyta-Purpureofilum_apyrenoidigerum.ctg17412:207-1658(+)
MNRADSSRERAMSEMQSSKTDDTHEKGRWKINLGSFNRRRRKTLNVNVTPLVLDDLGSPNDLQRRGSSKGANLMSRVLSITSPRKNSGNASQQYKESDLWNITGLLSPRVGFKSRSKPISPEALSKSTSPAFALDSPRVKLWNSISRKGNNQAGQQGLGSPQPWSPGSQDEQRYSHQIDTVQACSNEGTRNVSLATSRPPSHDRSRNFSRDKSRESSRRVSRNRSMSSARTYNRPINLHDDQSPMVEYLCVQSSQSCQSVISDESDMPPKPLLQGSTEYMTTDSETQALPERIRPSKSDKTSAVVEMRIKREPSIEKVRAQLRVLQSPRFMRIPSQQSRTQSLRKGLNPDDIPDSFSESVDTAEHIGRKLVTSMLIDVMEGADAMDGHIGSDINRERRAENRESNRTEDKRGRGNIVREVSKVDESSESREDSKNSEYSEDSSDESRSAKVHALMKMSNMIDMMSNRETGSKMCPARSLQVQR